MLEKILYKKEQIVNNPIRIQTKFLLLIFVILFSLFGCTSSESSNVSQGEEDYPKKYYFTTDWFSNNIRVWDKILSDYKGKSNIHYLEIGVFEGRSFFDVRIKLKIEVVACELYCE